MAERIPQSATIRVPLQAYLSSDHVSAATGKTIAITLSKNGAAYGNPSAGATNATEIASGSYYVDLSTTDTGTLGPLFVLGTATGVDSIVAIYNVVKATNGGFTALPDTACAVNATLPTVGTATGQINTDASGRVALRPIDTPSQRNGTAQAGGTTSITLDAGASSTDNLYTGQYVKLYSGTGTGQTRLITAYNGTSKVATVDHAWITNPDATSLFSVIAIQGAPQDSSLNFTGSIASVVGGVTVTTNNDKTGYTASTVSDKTGYSLSGGGIDAILDQASGIEANVTPRQGLRLMLAALAGKLSGAATTSVTIRDTNDTKNRISATVDANGNRTALTYDLT